MIETRTDGGIAHIGFDGGLIDYPALEALRETVVAATTDPSVRALVLDCESGGDNPTDMGEWPGRLAHRRPRRLARPRPLAGAGRHQGAARLP